MIFLHTQKKKLAWNDIINKKERENKPLHRNTKNNHLRNRLKQVNGASTWFNKKAERKQCQPKCNLGDTAADPVQTLFVPRTKGGGLTQE